jgi:hypothetical protein
MAIDCLMGSCKHIEARMLPSYERRGGSIEALVQTICSGNVR